MYTVGVDLGKHKSQFAVRGEDGSLVEEVKLPNRREVIEKFLKRLPGPVQVGCEACVNSYWLVEVVEGLKLPISVGHALDMKQIAHARIKTDKLDARVIGELLQKDFFPEIRIPPAEVRQARELLRGRAKLRRTAAQMRNRLHGVLTRAGVEYTASEAFGPEAEAWLEAADLKPAPKALARIYLATRRDVDLRVRDLDAEIARQVRPIEPWKTLADRLATIPGIGPYSALLLVLELWDVNRFPDGKHLASYIGLVPSVHQTGQTRRGGPLTKQGNRYVRWILVQDAWVAIRTCPRYHGIHAHHAKRQGRTRAIIPVARRLLFDVYEMWRHGITYDELVAREQARRQKH